MRMSERQKATECGRPLCPIQPGERHLVVWTKAPRRKPTRMASIFVQTSDRIVSMPSVARGRAG